MNSTNAEDVEENKSTFIDKILVEMKSEFNKNKAITDKSSDEKCESETDNPDSDSQPPHLKAEVNIDSLSNTSDIELTPPKITKIELNSDKESLDLADFKEKNSPACKKNKVGKVSLKIKTDLVKDEENIKSVLNVEESETKPRIVLTFRTDKLKPVVTSSFNNDKDNNTLDDPTSPGRRSLRIKTSIVDEKEKKTDVECGLKRSARRRSKDCNESVLQSAIARKEKSYNETARPQRLTRRLKPTAKILANLEMCQRTFKSKHTDVKKNTTMKSPSGSSFNKFCYPKGSEGSSETDGSTQAGEIPVKMSDHLHRKFKRKHKHVKSAKIAKKFKIKTDGKLSDGDSDSENSSFSSHQDVEVDHENEDAELEKRGPRKSDEHKTSRRSHRKSGRSIESGDSGEISEPLSGSLADQESLVPADPECSVLDTNLTEARKCLCQQKTQIYITTSGSADLVYCTAVDHVEGRVVGCNNVLSGELVMLRPSTRVPYIILCEVHRQRLLRHNCCPSCGVFCTQGRFAQCPSKHQYHRECQITVANVNCCPHCGLQTPDHDIEITMRCARKPVFLPSQKHHFPSAKMSFQQKSSQLNKTVVVKRSPSPPLIPPGVIAIQVVPEIDDKEEYDMITLYECVKEKDCEKVATVLGNGDVNLSEMVPGSDGSNILHIACQDGLLAIVHMLLIAGAEHDVLDKEQNTPLMIAIQAFHNTIVRYLIKSGACITLKGTDGMSALHIASKCGNLEACEFLLESAGNTKDYVNSADDGGWTPLVWACEHGHSGIAKYLLRHGADPLLRDVEQNIALHWAAFSGSTQITELLLNNGCDVNAVNAHGDSPLHVAARQDKYNCVLLLLARGANVHVENKTNETPLDCCVSQPSDCFTAISLNVHLQTITSTNSQRKHTILTNDISRGKETNPVQCVNTIDNETKPTDFVYVIENCITSDINVDFKITTLQSCQCEDKCTNGECVCSNNSLRCWYDDEGKLSPEFNYADPPMLFECNPACSCNAITCNNRVVQHGLTQRFQLFRTLNKGWGIRTLRNIPRGTYVCEYVGEIISDLDADQREDDSYLFDLDNRDGETYCIDARHYGNLSRFINHSCDPNLLPVRVFINHQDLRFPRIAFFANRDIQTDEELGFDYGEKFWIIKYKSFTCTCGYLLCKYSESTIKTTLENYNARLLEESLQETI